MSRISSPGNEKPPSLVFVLLQKIIQRGRGRGGVGEGERERRGVEEKRKESLNPFRKLNTKSAVIHTKITSRIYEKLWYFALEYMMISFDRIQYLAYIKFYKMKSSHVSVKKRRETLQRVSFPIEILKDKKTMSSRKTTHLLYKIKMQKK